MFWYRTVVKCTGATIAGLVCAAILCQTAAATVYVWTNTCGGFLSGARTGLWDVAGNWNPATGYPSQPGDVAEFRELGLPNINFYIKLPAGGVTVGVIRVVTRVTNSYLILGSASAPVVFTNTSGNASVACLDFVFPGGAQSQISFVGGSPIRFLSNTDMPIGQFNSNMLTFDGPWEGNATVTKKGSVTSWVFLFYTKCYSNFTGTVVAESGLFGCRGFYPGPCLTNPAVIRVKSAGVFEQRSGVAACAVVLEPGGKIYATQHSERSAILGNISLTGAVTFAAQGSTASYWGTVSGNGTLIYQSLSPAGVHAFAGRLSPGMSVAAAGTLTFNAANNGAVYSFGLSNRSVELVLDIGPGGMPGVSYDQLVLQNAPALDVSNMTVRFFGGTLTAETNWFLVANALVASTTFQNVVFDGGSTGEIVYAYSQNRIGAVVLPEPQALLLALLAGGTARLAGAWRGFCT